MKQKLRVWHMPQVGCDATMYIPVENAKDGAKLISILSAYDLFQLENRIKPDFCNANGLQQWNEEDQEWEDWYIDNEEGYFDDLDEYVDGDEEIVSLKHDLFSQLKK